MRLGHRTEELVHNLRIGALSDPVEEQPRIAHGSEDRGADSTLLGQADSEP